MFLKKKKTWKRQKKKTNLKNKNNSRCSKHLSILLKMYFVMSN